MSVFSPEKDKKISELFETYDFIEPDHIEIPETLLKEGHIEHAIECIKNN